MCQHCLSKTGVGGGGKNKQSSKVQPFIPSPWWLCLWGDLTLLPYLPQKHRTQKPVCWSSQLLAVNGSLYPRITCELALMHQRVECLFQIHRQAGAFFGAAEAKKENIYGTNQCCDFHRRAAEMLFSCVAKHTFIALLSFPSLNLLHESCGWRLTEGELNNFPLLALTIFCWCCRLDLREVP